MVPLSIRENISGPPNYKISANLSVVELWTHTKSSMLFHKTGSRASSPWRLFSLLPVDSKDFFFFGFLMWIFFYPFTTQQDKALERQPLDRVTQFSQMETLVPKNWKCLVQRLKRKCRVEPENVSSIQRLGCSDTLHTIVALSTWHPQEKRSPLCHATWVVTVLLLFLQPNYFILLDSCPFSTWMYGDLYLFSGFRRSMKWIWWSELHQLFTQRRGIPCDCLHSHLSWPGEKKSHIFKIN